MCGTDADVEVGVDVPQERGAIIFAQGRPIGRSIVPTAVACTRRSCVWTCETRVKPPPLPSPSPSPPPPPRTSTSGAPARSEIHARRVLVLSYRPPVSSCLRVSIYIYISLSLSFPVSLYPYLFTFRTFLIPPFPPDCRASSQLLLARTQYKQQRGARESAYARGSQVESVALRQK